MSVLRCAELLLVKSQMKVPLAASLITRRLKYVLVTIETIQLVVL